MRWNTVLLCLAILLIATALTIGVRGSRKLSNNKFPCLTLIAYTNLNGRRMALFEIQHEGRGRILPKEGYFLFGENHQEPARSWHCNAMEAYTNRLHPWRDIRRLPSEYLPALSNCATGRTRLLVPTPTSRPGWRLGLNVFPEEKSLMHLVHIRLTLAWYSRDPTFLVKPLGYVGTSSTWVESDLVTNSVASSETFERK
jgi:hypothetical protein